MVKIIFFCLVPPSEKQRQYFDEELTCRQQFVLEGTPPITDETLKKVIQNRIRKYNAPEGQWQAQIVHGPRFSAMNRRHLGFISAI